MKKNAAEYWAPKIATEWRKSVEAIIAVGRHLIAAKEACEHGEFMRLFKESGDAVSEPLPFTVNTAERLMAVARHPVLSNPAHVQTLPQSWGTLYELTKVPDAELILKLTGGEITTEMTRAQAAAMHADPIERSVDPLDAATHEIKLCVSRHERKLDSRERLTLIFKLRQLAEHVEFGLTHPPIGGDLEESIVERLRRERAIPDTIVDDRLAMHLRECGFPVLAKAIEDERAPCGE
jgi:hypothetical protein